MGFTSTIKSFLAAELHHETVNFSQPLHYDDHVTADNASKFWSFY